MSNLFRRTLVIALFSLSGFALSAQEAPPPKEEPAEEAAAEDEQKYEELVVVTASRKEQLVHDVPAAISVITAKDIQDIPADDIGDLLRNVPGLNIVQLGARDIQVAGRESGGSLSTHQLVLLDNRTLYLDFFGFVMWDFVPVNTNEIKQIEVVRGPGSAVWGANAMSGVINVITKKPSEMVGTSVMFGGGELGTLMGSLSHAGVNGEWGYKFSASYYEQDAFERPTGLIPGSPPPGTPYPPFQNEGTEQPKVDLRFDRDSLSSNLSFSAGYAGTDGLIHTGIGPFDIDKGAFLAYGKFDWYKSAMRVGGFFNKLDADSDALLSVGTDFKPLKFGFKSETYNLDFGNTSVVGSHNIFTYGANVRQNKFDLSIAPGADKREEYGGFLQDEILFGTKARWLVGVRADNLDPIGTVVSPRTALMISPVPNHTIRASYNRAFRSPSVINTDLDTAIVSVVRLPTGLFPFATAARGNPNLQEETLDAIELGYVGTWERGVILSLSIYRNKTKDQSDFFPATYYSSANPPRGWPLPPQFVPPNTLPSSFSYRNIGEVIDKGVEVGVNMRSTPHVSWFLNYSFQDTPEVSGVDPAEVSTPPEHRANLGVSWDNGLVFVNTNVNYQDEARWTDVLDSRFWGTTDAFTAVNLSTGFRFAAKRATFTLTGTNIFDEEVQQHVFGDIISRKVTGQIQYNF